MTTTTSANRSRTGTDNSRKRSDFNSSNSNSSDLNSSDFSSRPSLDSRISNVSNVTTSSGRALDQQRENEVYRRRQERDEDERRDENFNRQKQERDEAFERQEALRRRQTEWTRQVPLIPVAPAQRTCRVITFKTISAAEALNYSSAAEDEVVTYATIAGDFGAGLVGFTIRGNNAGKRVARFEVPPTSKLVDLQYAEGCRHTGGPNYTCQRLFKAVRGAVEFEAMTAPSAPLGRLVAHVKNTTLVAWDTEQQSATPGGECLTLVGFNFDSTFFPQ